MDARKIYERVAFDGMEMSEQKFCEYLTEAVQHTASEYGEKYVVGKNGTVRDIVSFGDSLDIYDDYAPCLAEYVKYLAGNERSYEMYLAKANGAYLNVWRKVSKGKAMRPGLRGEVYV